LDNDVDMALRDFCVDDDVCLVSPQPSPRELDEVGSKRGPYHADDRGFCWDESAYCISSPPGALNTPLPGCVDHSARLSKQKSHLLAELAVRDTQLASLRSRLEQVGPSQKLQQPQQRIEGTWGSTEDVDSTVRIDAALMEKLCCITGVPPSDGRRRHMGSGRLQPKLSTHTARRRSVSYGIAADLSRSGRKRLVAELGCQSHISRRHVHVPVDVASNQRSASLPPMEFQRQSNPMPAYMKPVDHTGRRHMLPELAWWPQVIAVQQQTQNPWSGGCGSAWPGQHQSSPQRPIPCSAVRNHPQVNHVLGGYWPLQPLRYSGIAC